MWASLPSPFNFCPACGSVGGEFIDSREYRCPACGFRYFHNVATAAGVVVERGGKFLFVVRAAEPAKGKLGLPGGFVDPGESVEAALRREVREEVGVEIANLRYFASQAWPFPNSLMVAFFADYAGGLITPDPSEIEAAEWFSMDALPLLPDPVSISRRLIDAACA